MPDQEVRICACGCGEAFVPHAHNHLFVNRAHQLRGSGPSSSDVKALQDENVKLRQLLDRYSFVKSADTRTPDWLKPQPHITGTLHHATPVLLLSDWHLDEKVDREEMDGVNEYDRHIAMLRLEAVVTGTVKLLKRFVSGVVFDGLVTALLGDILTGVIHDELARTNEAPPSASIVYWVPYIAEALRYLSRELDVPVFAPCVDGNHDRFYKQTPMKERATSSLAWIIYNWLADTLRDDANITFGITTAAEQLVPVYDTTLLLSHGDSFRSSGGVGGLYPSMLKWLLRRHQFYSSAPGLNDFDVACIGHWHSPLDGPDFCVNNSLKGYDEYAKNNGFTFSEPSQQLFVVTPERGITQRLEVWAS